MNNTTSKSILGAVAGVLVASSTLTMAQTAVVETKTLNSVGTVTEFQPNALIVRTEAAEPISYRYTKTTTYVDETGAPVSVEMIKSGLPVTVHYVREGDAFVASRVIVRKAAPAPTVIEKSTTTTTTKKEKD